ncbi:hypothetical protein DUI87_22183 [Hirundo rustica rustica]|uniref:F5/8 type C domain-containing protein n=1 Tax=Hirundo rustica rustica TaxID=333673 RepID=A0A3M0JQ88_HIRRU|nr:hypothetical protein DUI87_22183 [Hirundo rustica rustica]
MAKVQLTCKAEDVLGNRVTLAARVIPVITFSPDSASELGKGKTQIRCSGPLGIEGGIVSNQQITASSTHRALFGLQKWYPYYARLNKKGLVNAWTAAENDRWPWIQVFRGNVDNNTPYANSFTPPIKAQYIRLYPQVCRRHCTLRMELLGCELTGCSEPLGMKSGHIQDFQITASSVFRTLNMDMFAWEPRKARLDKQGKVNAWTSGHNDQSQWLQLNFGKRLHEGPSESPGPPETGLSPSVGSRGGGILPLCPSAETPPAELPQPWDQHRKELELLEPGQRRLQDEQRDGAALLGGKAARAGIVQPGQEKLWGDLSVALRCLKGLQERWRETMDKGWRDRTRGMASQCQRAGMDGCGQGIVPCEGGQALAQGAQRSCGCPWIPGSVQGQAGHWGLEQPGTVEEKTAYWLVRVDLLIPTKITGIITQGAKDFGHVQFVGSYKLAYSNDGEHWKIYQDEKQKKDKVFQGNFDNDTHRKNVIEPPIYARHVRILPWSWYGRITLRSELLGCAAED